MKKVGKIVFICSYLLVLEYLVKKVLYVGLCVACGVGVLCLCASYVLLFAFLFVFVFVFASLFVCVLLFFFLGEVGRNADGWRRM